MPTKMPGGIHGRHLPHITFSVQTVLQYTRKVQNQGYLLSKCPDDWAANWPIQTNISSSKANVRRTSRHRWHPHLVISDYEQSLIAAVETELPNARISGCYFHFGQNLWRRVQSLGLARDYRQNRRLKKTIRKVITIGYLPMALVRQTFLLLITSRRTRRLQCQFPELLHFFNYFEANYLNGIFVPQMWNVYE